MAAMRLVKLTGGLRHGADVRERWRPWHARARGVHERHRGGSHGARAGGHIRSRLLRAVRSSSNSLVIRSNGRGRCGGKERDAQHLYSCSRHCSRRCTVQVQDASSAAGRQSAGPLSRFA
eukprot:61748-Prorocentrum_minimum.AAC.1